MAVDGGVVDDWWSHCHRRYSMLDGNVLACLVWHHDLHIDSASWVGKYGIIMTMKFIILLKIDCKTYSGRMSFTHHHFISTIEENTNQSSTKQMTMDLTPPTRLNYGQSSNKITGHRKPHTSTASPVLMETPAVQNNPGPTIIAVITFRPRD